MTARILFITAHGYPDAQAFNTGARRAALAVQALSAMAAVDLVVLRPRRDRQAPPPDAAGLGVDRLVACPVPAGARSGALAFAWALARGRSPTVAVKRSAPARRLLERLLRERSYDLVYVFSPLSAACLPWAALRDTVPVAVEVVEVLGETFREYRNEPWTRIGWRIALEARGWRDLQRFETVIYRAAARVLCLSGDEAGRVTALDDRIVTRRVPLTVDSRRFRPADAAGRPHDGTLLFTGNFRHPPNVAAVIDIARTILPRVRREIPSARLRVVGRHARRVPVRHGGEGIERIDTVPDLAPFYHRAAAVLGPIRTGRGVRGKFLEALACGCPVITTTLGASGIALTPADGLLVANDAAGLARHAVAMLRDPDRRASLAPRAAAAIRRHHDDTAHAAALHAALGDFIQTRLP